MIYTHSHAVVSSPLELTYEEDGDSLRVVVTNGEQHLCLTLRMSAVESMHAHLGAWLTDRTIGAGPAVPTAAQLVPDDERFNLATGEIS